MRLVVLGALIIFAFPLAALAQPYSYNSVCLPNLPVPEGVILTICEQNHGMGAWPTPKLYLRIFADGRAQYEVLPPIDQTGQDRNIVMQVKEFRVDPDEVAFIEASGRASDFQDSPETFPTVRPWMDSSTETTVRFFDHERVKQVVVGNFSVGDYEFKKRYPPSFFALMEKAELLREQGMGIVRPIPNVSFCDLIRYRDYYVGKPASINANLELHGPIQFLNDPNCDTPASGTARTKERIGVEYPPKKGEAPGVWAARTAQLSTSRFGGRARVLITGILRHDPDRARDSYAFWFEISDFKTVEPIVLPYQGRLETGWTYSDAIDQIEGKELALSSRLKMPLHHAARIEWTNLESFPALKTGGRKYLTFRVVTKVIQPMGSGRWNDEYVCELIEVKLSSRVDDSVLLDG
jgi:hypothetical protein